MINAVNSVNFQGRLGGYSKHTPKMRPYREFEFMPELQKKNYIKILLESMNKVPELLEKKMANLCKRLRNISNIFN